MKSYPWAFYLGLLRRGSVFAQYITTVKVDTGSCAPSYSGGASFGNSGAGGEGIASVSGDFNPLSPLSSVTPLVSATISGSATASSSAASPSSGFSPPAPGEPFFINIQPSSRLRRRQGQADSPGYIDPNGQATDDCYNSTIYVLSANGTLCTSDGGCFSTSPGTVSQPFVPSTELGSISTTWTFSNGNNLVWSNDEFLINPAVICRNSITDTVEIYFQVASPASCVPLSLSSAPLSQCPGIQASQASQASSKPKSTSLSASTTGPGLSGSAPITTDIASSIPDVVATPPSTTGASSAPESTFSVPGIADSSVSEELPLSATETGASEEVAPTSVVSDNESTFVPAETSALSLGSEVTSSAAATDAASSMESAMSISDPSLSESSFASEETAGGSSALSSGTITGSSSDTSAASSGPSSTGTSTPSADGLAYHGYVRPEWDGIPNPAQYNGKSDPNVAGIAGNINFASDSAGDIIFPGQTGTTNVASPAYAVVYQGYFLAPETAEYTLYVTTATDDFGFIWTGDKAKSLWTNDNTDADGQFNDHDKGATFQPAQGAEIPVTIVWVNAATAGGLSVAIYSSVTSQNVSDTTGYFVSPKASDGFSNGDGTPSYSPVPAQSSVSVSSVIASSTSVAATSSDIAASLSGVAASSSGVAESSSAVVASSSEASGATASSSGATTSSTSSAAPARGFVYSAFTNPSYDGTNKAASVAFFNSNNNPLVSCGISEDPNFSPSSQKLPGQTARQDLTKIGVVYHGYFTPPYTGTYYINLNTKSFSYAWAGNNAYTAWTSGNAQADDTHSDPFTWTQGQQVPMTILYANLNDPNANFNFQITYDDGKGGEHITDFTGLLDPPKDADVFTPSPASSCTVPTACDTNGFSQYYFGSGYVFSGRNMANGGNPKTVPYTAEVHQSTVVADCGAKTKALGYEHMDIHFDKVDNSWYCVQYQEANTDPQYWSDATIPADRVVQAYGYSHCT